MEIRAGLGDLPQRRRFERAGVAGELADVGSAFVKILLAHADADIVERVVRKVRPRMTRRTMSLPEEQLHAAAEPTRTTPSCRPL